MICLDNTDTLEGGASVDAVVDYTVHGLVGSVFTVLADGQLSDTDPSVLYTAEAATSIVSITFVNTHTVPVDVNLYLDSANAGNPRRMIPKGLKLDAGQSLCFDGQRLSIIGGSLSYYAMIIWRMITHEASGDQDPLGGGGADWEISDDSKTENQLGNTAVTESNGVFSFTSTGYWSVRAYGTVSNGVADESRTQLQIKATDDNSAYAVMASGSAEFEVERYGNPSCEALLKIEDIANDKVRLAIDSADPNTEFLGSGTENWTYVVFEKKADL